MVRSNKPISGRLPAYRLLNSRKAKSALAATVLLDTDGVTKRAPPRAEARPTARFVRYAASCLST